MTTEDAFTVEVVYALSNQQLVLPVVLKAGATVKIAIEQSGITERFPEIDLNQNMVGIFGQVCPLDQTLRGGDRVEIYRPLIHDPKEARRRRAEKNLKLKRDKFIPRNG